MNKVVIGVGVVVNLVSGVIGDVEVFDDANEAYERYCEIGKEYDLPYTVLDGELYFDNGYEKEVHLYYREVK